MPDEPMKSQYIPDSDKAAIDLIKKHENAKKWDEETAKQPKKEWLVHFKGGLIKTVSGMFLQNDKEFFMVVGKYGEGWSYEDVTYIAKSEVLLVTPVEKES